MFSDRICLYNGGIGALEIAETKQLLSEIQKQQLSIEYARFIKIKYLPDLKRSFSKTTISKSINLLELCDAMTLALKNKIELLTSRELELLREMAWDLPGDS